jgi:ankyrin repeat protein
MTWWEIEWPPGTLHAAASVNDVPLITTLSGRGMGVDDMAEFGVTPLHVACWEGAHDAARKLIELGANVNAQNLAGTTPLAAALAKAHSFGSEIVEELLAAGADPDLQNNSGSTPRSLAKLLDDQLPDNLSRFFE